MASPEVEVLFLNVKVKGESVEEEVEDAKGFVVVEGLALLNVKVKGFDDVLLLLSLSLVESVFFSCCGCPQVVLLFPPNELLC